MKATIDEIFENEEILEHIEIVHSLHENQGICILKGRL